MDNQEDLQEARQAPMWEYLILAGICGLGFYIAFIPHASFPYLVHIDEWVHLTFSKALINAGSVTFTEPFHGEGTLGIASNLEAGFHVLLSVFQSISGMSWLAMFKYLPALIFVLIILSVYVTAQRDGFGWEAALFTCLIPTTVGILGPGFLVPLAMGLMFITLSIFVAFNFTSIRSYVVLFIFVSFLLSIHAVTAVGVVIILAPYALLNLRGNFRHGLGVILALVIPFVAPFAWIIDMLLPTAKALLEKVPFPTHVDIPMVMQTYGVVAVGLCLLGTFVIVIMGEKKSLGLVLGLLATLVMLAIFYTFNYGIDILYERGLTYAMLMMGIVAGYALMYIRTFDLPPEIELPFNRQFIKIAGIVVCVALIGITFAIAIPARQNTRYYHMITDEDYKAFVWISENVNDDYQKALINPWKSTAFVAITGKYVYSRTHSYPTARDEEAMAFLRRGCTDTSFLEQNGLSMVYTELSCNNEDLQKVSENVYLLK